MGISMNRMNNILAGAGLGSREKMVLSPWQNHRSITVTRGMNGYGKGPSPTES